MRLAILVLVASLSAAPRAHAAEPGRPGVGMRLYQSAKKKTQALFARVRGPDQKDAHREARTQQQPRQLTHADVFGMGFFIP
jgi:hypothetical protein